VAAKAAQYDKALGFTATIGTGSNGPNNRPLPSQTPY
jgi:hypothetical protein